MDKVKRRMSKTSRQQYEIYLNELETNPTFRENKFTPEEPHFLKECWDNLVQKLNSSGGPIKDVGAWKRTFSDWKAHVRKRARDLKYAQKATGNLGEPEKSLSDIELRLLQITGKIVVDGLPVVELGIETGPSIIQKGPVEEAPEPPRKKKGSLIQYVKDIAAGVNTTNNASNTSEDIVAVLKSMDNKMDLLIDNQNKIIELLNKN